VIVETRATDVGSLTARAERVFAHRLDGADRDIAHTTARLRALSPKATLDRGYAIVHRLADGQIVRTPEAVAPGDALRIRVAGGDVAASVTEPADTEPADAESADAAPAHTAPTVTEPTVTEPTVIEPDSASGRTARPSDTTTETTPANGRPRRSAARSKR